MEGYTLRQKQVAWCIAKGMSDKEIGPFLGVGYQTAKKHIAAVLRKYNLPNRTALVTHAIYHGVIECPEPMTNEDLDIWHRVQAEANRSSQ